MSLDKTGIRNAAVLPEPDLYLACCDKMTQRLPTSLRHSNKIMALEHGRYSIALNGSWDPIAAETNVLKDDRMQARIIKLPNS